MKVEVSHTGESRYPFVTAFFAVKRGSRLSPGRQTGVSSGADSDFYGDGNVIFQLSMRPTSILARSRTRKFQLPARGLAPTLTA